MKEHPVRSAFDIIIASLVGFVFVFVGVWAWKAEGGPRVWLHKLQVLTWSGVLRVYPVRPYHKQTKPKIDHREKAEEDLRSAICSSGGTIKLLLASGYRHIGHDKCRGSLFYAIDENAPRLKMGVMLLAPDGRAARERAEQEGIDHRKYSDGIRSVIWTLAYWKRSLGLDVRVWLYDERPIWQMMLSEEEIWLLCAVDTDVDDSPVFRLSRNSEYGLGKGLAGVWKRRLDMAKEEDLDAVTSEPKWKELFHREHSGTGQLQRSEH